MTLEELKKLITGNRGAAELPHFIASGVDVNSLINDSKWTLLHLAVEFENLPMITALINVGADIEARDANGWTPLHLAIDADIDSAAQANYEEGAFLRGLTFSTAALLVSAGADLNSKFENGETQRDFVSRYGKEVLRKFDEVIASQNS